MAGQREGWTRRGALKGLGSLGAAAALGGIGPGGEGVAGEAAAPAAEGFADHLEKHLLIPSLRYTRAGPHPSTGLASSFTYQPPPGTHWAGR